MKENKVFKIICILLCFQTVLRAQQSQDYELQEIKITDKINPQKLTKSAATHFTARFAENFAAEILQYRAVSCRDVYCEFNAYKGIIAYMDFNRDLKPLVFKNPAGNLHLAPLSVMRSNPYTADGEVLELTALYPEEHSCEKAFLSGYINYPWGEALHVKRAVELLSPLNPKMNPMYRYEVTRMFEDKRGEQWAEIRFETKEGVFPGKCRLLGKGSLLYNISRRTIRQIVLEDYVDFYSSYIRKESFNGNMATRHRVEINYEEQNGRIFPVSVQLDVMWQKPDPVNGDDFIYAPIRNSRRNPFKYKLKEKEYVSFQRYKLLDNVLEKRLKEIPVFGGKYTNVPPNQYYSAPYDKAEWDRTVFPGIDMQQVKRDLYRAGESLEEQSEKNAAIGYDLYFKSNGDFGHTEQKTREQHRAFSKQYYQVTKHKIIPLIWGCD